MLYEKESQEQNCNIQKELEKKDKNRHITEGITNEEAAKTAD